MPTSSTGKTSAPRRADAGFTLVEALLALALLGLMAGAVLVLAPRGHDASAAFAERLALRLAAAAEESIVVNRTVAMTATAEGYGFARLEEAGWALIQDGRTLGFEIWPEGIEVRSEQGRAPAASAPNEPVQLALFEPWGAAEPVVLLVRYDGELVWRLSVSGEGRTRLERTR